MPLSDFLGILDQYRGASAANPPATVEQDYSQVAPSAPQSHLASGLAEAFRSDETPPFGQMLGTLFSNSNGQQRAGILNRLLGAVGPGLLAKDILKQTGAEDIASVGEASSDYGKTDKPLSRDPVSETAYDQKPANPRTRTGGGSI